MSIAKEIGGHSEFGHDPATPCHVEDFPVYSGPRVRPGIRLVLDLSSDDLRNYLVAVSGDFNPAAETTLDIRGYADKLAQKGRTIAAVWDAPGGERIMGILAGYFNNPGQGFSYVSAFHVRLPFRRMHIGRMLMDKAVEISRDAGFEAVRLKVDKTNAAGIGFYERNGFARIGEDSKQFEMYRDLRGNGHDGM